MCFEGHGTEHRLLVSGLLSWWTCLWYNVEITYPASQICWGW